MSENLLIVFGGTTQSKVQGIFKPHELKESLVDVIQFNLLTVKSNVIASLKDNGYQEINLITASPGKSITRDLEATINKDLHLYGYQELQKELKTIKDAIEEVNWSRGVPPLYSENSDSRGMTPEACNIFSSVSKSLIISFLSKISNNYKNIFVLAHSRGCSLAINALSRDSQKGDFNIDDNALTDKLKRIVLLDPVSKNVGLTHAIRKGNVEVIRNLSRYKRQIEIHFVVKTKSSTLGTNYGSFVDYLVGAEADENEADAKVNKEAEPDEHKLSSCNPHIPDMKNIYVHLAHMVHEGMLEEKLRESFKKYKEIISHNDWNKMYSSDDLIDIEKLKTSAALNQYIEGRESANNISPKEGDSIRDFFLSFEIDDIRYTLKDRRKAFVHCVASKVYEAGA